MGTTTTELYIDGKWKPALAGGMIDIIDPATERPRYGEYVVGWAKRGPTGVIGTNKPDAIESVNSMLEDLSSGRIEPAPDADPAAVVELLEARNVRFVTMDEWGKLNELELSNGKAQGRPRVKFTNLDNMLAALEGAG